MDKYMKNSLLPAVPIIALVIGPRTTSAVSKDGLCLTKAEFPNYNAMKSDDENNPDKTFTSC
jgi:hypothetical protein